MDKIAQAKRTTWETLVIAEPLGELVGAADGATLDIAEVDKGADGAAEVAFAEDVTAIPVEERADMMIGSVGLKTVVELRELEGRGVLGMGTVTVVSVDGPLAVLVAVFEEEEEDSPMIEILGDILLSSPRTYNSLDH